MTEYEKEYIQNDLKNLFPDGTELKYNDTRTYNMYTITKESNLTIAFDIQNNIAEYMLIKED